MADSLSTTIGAVAIGRNEGLRLKRCLVSLRSQLEHVVYVDSGSEDNSVAMARELGVTVVELDTSIPFTAARARNAGALQLLELCHELEFIHFVDGDCELYENWIPLARETMEQHPEAGIVAGIRRERYPKATVYNLLCHLEWDASKGEVLACGGDFLVRKETYLKIQGFNPSVIAAEDDEFCVRVRKAGWKVLRLDEDMTKHDAAMRTFGQWWKRAVRAGHGYAQVGSLHPDYFVKERLRTAAWGLGIPIAAILLAIFTKGWGLLLLGLYPLSLAKTYLNLRSSGLDKKSARAHAWFLTLAKFPNALGLLTFFRRQLTGQRFEIIEYKSAHT